MATGRMVFSRHERTSEQVSYVIRNFRHLFGNAPFTSLLALVKAYGPRIPNYSLSFGVSAVEDLLRSALRFVLRDYIHYSGTTKTKCNNAEIPRLNTRPVHHLLLRAEANNFPLLHDIQALLKRVL